VRETTRLGDALLVRGDQVIVLLAAADRDPARFAGDADEFRIGRHGGRHLAFGTGIHTCPGASLARLEADVAFRALFRWMPGLRSRFPDSPPWWRSTGLSRGLAALPVMF
jgi:cytochrome P450